MGEPRPDMIIAIDFGMTCAVPGLFNFADMKVYSPDLVTNFYPGTGVAYANLSVGSDTIRWIQRWPGRMQANENKVITAENPKFPVDIANLW